MKIHNLLLFTLLFSFFTPKLSGQTNKPCNNYDCAYKKAEIFLKNKEYQKALDNLDSAEGYLTDTNTKEKEQIKQLRRRLFVAIEQEKEDAKKARETAYRKRKELEIEKVKNQKIINALYFYKDKYALVYQYTGEYTRDFSRDYDVKYGFYFIDKEGNESIKGKMFDIAFPFDENKGFARVKVNEEDSIYSYLDTLGNLYPFVTRLEKLNDKITALDLTNSNIIDVPLSVFKNTQLKVILLCHNKITSLGFEFKGLSNLSILNLKGNPISEQEQEKIKKTTPKL